MTPLTTLGKEIALLSNEVLARVRALGSARQYRVLRKCPVRSRAARAGDVIEYLDPTMNDGSPNLVVGRPARPGWIEVGKGYVFSGNLRRMAG